MTIIDISVPLSENLPFWTGSSGFSIKRIWKMEEGKPANVSELAMDVHSGTHIDAPWHFVADGKKTLEVDLGTLIGKAYVADFTGKETIYATDFEAVNLPKNLERLLLKTDNSALWSSENRSTFYKDFTALAPCAAQWLVDHNIALVGIDYLSIQKYHDGPETHQILLEKEVVVIESLNLADVTAGWYHLTCLPLSIAKAEGAPARAILQPLTKTESPAA